MTKFWYNWWLAWCALLGLFGLVLAGAGFEATDGPARFLLATMNPTPVEYNEYLRFALGLLGSLSLGLAVLYFAAARAEMTRRLGRSFWMTAFAALVVWYVVDNIISLANGFFLNVASNTLIVILFLIPWLKSGVLEE